MPYVGLVNNLNSCFINAIIQMLYRIPEAKSLDTEPLKTFFAKMATAEAEESPIAKAVDLELGTNPGDFECPLTQISSGAKDEDARKRNERFIEKEKSEINVKKSNPRAQQDAAEFLLKSILNKNEKLTLFNFELKTQSFCIDKKNEVKHYEEAVKTPEKTISLELKENSVQKNIDLFLKDELLPDDYAECKKYSGTRGVKKTSIQSSQNYLIVQLKRFDQNLQKISKDITINEKITVSGKQWALQGAVLHTGTLTIGHYLYLWKDANTWILFNDSTVSNPETSVVQKELNTNGYILLYKKCEGAACPAKAANRSKHFRWRNNITGNNRTKQSITIPATTKIYNLPTRKRSRSRNRNTTHANSKPPTNAKPPPANAKLPPANNKRRRTQKKKYGFKSFIKSLLTPKDKGEYEKLIYREDPLIKELVLNKVVPR
jgi:uncharacterized UBP type Zn finger protein